MMNVIELRRRLHKIPEPSKKEYATAEFIKEYLKDKTTLYEVGETGVVAFFDFGKQYSACFRADMDALPVTERTGVDYSSENLGYMHACGHDGHMAMLLSFADYLYTAKKTSPYNVVLLFQPSEEERGGAISIIQSGILAKLNVVRMYGTHIWPKLPEGRLCTMAGAMLASSTEVDIKINGKSVHAADYKNGADALEAAAYFLTKTYAAEKSLPSEEKRLLRCGKFTSGKARNVVADKAELLITMRSFTQETYDKLRSILEEVKKKTDEKYGVKTLIDLHSDYHFVYNSATLLSDARQNDYYILKEPFMQAEDFGNYTDKLPCLFFLLGAGDVAGLHTPYFNFNEQILEQGVANYIRLFNSFDDTLTK